MSATNIVIRKRITVLFLLVGLALILLIGRLAWIQFVRGEQLRNEALANRMDDIPVPTKRGAIYDRNGRELVVSISSDSVSAFPPIVKSGDAKKTAEELARVLDLKYEDVYARITKNTNFEYIKRRVESEKIRELKELNLPGIDFVEESQRSYPKGKFAAHILGFVGTDNIGLDGLESKLDKELAGVPGRIIIEKDARGREIPQALHERVAPIPGNNVILTLDETIQYFVERELDNIVAQYQPKGATIIVMEPKTGGILAMANRPDYEPSEYGKAPAEARRNLAVQLNYEPGSTFKVVTAAAALDEGVVTPERRFFDQGYIIVNDRRIKCWRYPRSHGEQSFTEVVMNSCNPGFIEIGLDLGAQKFYEYIRAFGFGQKTGINLTGEATGILIAEKNLKPVNIATISIGQSISVTPLQLLTAAAAVANDGMLMKPQIVKAITDSKGKIIDEIEPEPVRQVVSKTTARQLSGILEQVVTAGTGHNAYLDGYRVAGKTGTAQKVGDGGYMDGHYVSSFLGFAPADNPKLSILVVIDDAQGGAYYGGVIAAPVFQNLAKDILRYLNVTPQLSSQDIKDRTSHAEVLVPDVVNNSLDTALNIMRTAGLQTRIDGEGSWVVDQQPKAGAKTPAGSKIILYLGEQGITIPEGQLITVPDLTGLPMREAGQLLGRLSLGLEPEGTGIAVAQTTAPGIRVKTGTKINVLFSPPVSEPSP